MITIQLRFMRNKMHGLTIIKPQVQDTTHKVSVCDAHYVHYLQLTCAQAPRSGVKWPGVSNVGPSEQPVRSHDPLRLKDEQHDGDLRGIHPRNVHGIRLRPVSDLRQS